MSKAGKNFSLFNPELKSLFTAQAFSNLGNFMVTITLSFFVYEMTGSPLNVAMIYLVTVLPSILSLSVGPILERLSLKRLMIASDLVRAILIGVIPFVIPYSIVVVYVLVFFSTFLSVVFQSARMTVLVDAAEGVDLNRVNSFDQTLQQIGTLLGMALGGLLVGVDYKWAFWTDSLTFIVSAIFIAKIQSGSQPLRKEKSKVKLWSEFKDGCRYISKEAVLSYNIFGYLLITIGGGAFNAMLVIYAVSHLHAGNLGYTFLEIAQLIGIILVGLIMSFITQKYYKGRLLAFGGVFFGLFMMAIAFTNSLLFAGIFCFLMGGFNLIVYAISQTMLMEVALREHQGKVMSVRVALSRTGNTIGALLSGWLVEYTQFSVAMTIALSGLAIVLCGVLAIFIPSVINYKFISKEISTTSSSIT